MSQNLHNPHFKTAINMKRRTTRARSTRIEKRATNRVTNITFDDHSGDEKERESGKEDDPNEEGLSKENDGEDDSALGDLFESTKDSVVGLNPKSSKVLRKQNTMAARRRNILLKYFFILILYNL